MVELKVGYEVGTGEPVHIPIHHLVVTGLTRLSGKTTTLEALITRSGLRGVIFKTKKGELGFPEANPLPLFYKEKSDWQYVEGLLSARMRERMKFERGFIIQACKGAKTLRDVHKNILHRLERPRQREFVIKILTELSAYFELILPELEKIHFAEDFNLADGLNVMDVTGLSEEIQMLIIHSVLTKVYEDEKDVILVLPEVWKLIPQGRGTPVKLIAEHLVREGGARGIWIWADAQDVAGTEKRLLKSVDNWLLGRQREFNEVQRLLKQIPLPKKAKPKEEQVMNLKLGHFYACFGDTVKQVYVQPSWLPDEEAVNVALGKLPAEKAGKYEPKRELEEDLVWKEKYEKLKEEHIFLIKTTEPIKDLKDQLKQQSDTILKLGKKVDSYDKVEKALTSLREVLIPNVITGTVAPSKTKDVTLEHSEVSVNIKHTEPTEIQMNTETGMGKILYCATQDLNCKPFNKTKIHEALTEHGWPMGHKALWSNILNCIKQGYLIKTGTTKDTAYRLPSRLTFKTGEM